MLVVPVPPPEARLAPTGKWPLPPEGVEAAANLIRFNEHVFMRTGFPKTAALLAAEGYSIRQLGADQAARVDGGLSCMSLRISL